MSTPIIGIADTRFVITVAPHKLIWPQGKTYPIKAVAIITMNNTTPTNHTKLFKYDP